jgi:hypothetical protein
MPDVRGWAERATVLCSLAFPVPSRRRTGRLVSGARRAAARGRTRRAVELPAGRRARDDVVEIARERAGWLDLAYTSRVPRVYLPAVPASGHHRSRAVTMSAGAGRKRDGRPLSVRGTGMSVRMRARSRQPIAMPRLSSTSCPLRPASLPEPARSSRARPPARSRAAVTGPMPGDALDAVGRISGQPGPLWVRS